MKEISFFDLLSLAWEKLWALLLAGIIAGGCAFGVCTFMLEDRYTATASIMVTNGAITDNTAYEKVQGTDLTASLELTDTVVELLKTSNIFKQLENKTTYGYSYKQLKNIASISRASQDTLFVKIRFTTNSKEESINLCNAFAELVPEYVSQTLKNSNIKVVEEADSAPKVYPRTVVATAISAFIGIVICYIILLIVRNMNHTITSDEDISAVYGVPLLGTVPVFEALVSGKAGKKNEYR
mgnify:FL=1